MFRLILATIIGYVLGKERKKNDKSGGSRTMGIICMSSCLISIISLELNRMNYDDFNISRLMSYGIASIGFVGSGIIIQTKGQVEGLTSASVLFGLVPIGYCIGLNLYGLGIGSAILLYILLESKYFKTNKKVKNAKNK